MQELEASTASTPMVWLGWIFFVVELIVDSGCGLWRRENGGEMRWRGVLKSDVDFFCVHAVRVCS